MVNKMLILSIENKKVIWAASWQNQQSECVPRLKMLCEPPRDKSNKMTVRPTKTQISLGIRPV